jgi:hypothetical protein
MRWEESRMWIEHVLAEITPPSFIVEAPQPPAAVLDCFVRFVESGEIETAIRLLSRELVTCIGFEKLESIFSTSSSEIWLAGGIESVDVQTVAFSRDHAEMRLSIWYGDHKVECDVVRLVREHGLWKISMEELENLLANKRGRC